MIVRPMTVADRPAWDIFVNQQADSSFFHLSFWQDILEKGAGLTTRFLLAEQDGAFAGVLPLTLHKSPIFGRAVKSIAYGVEGGALVTGPEAQMALDKAAWQIASDMQASYLEYRSLKAVHMGERGWHQKDQLYARFRRPILEGQEANILALPNKQRPTVRKGMKAGLVCRFDGALDDFYAHYSASLHRLGTPMFPKAYFKALRAYVPADQLDILTVSAPHGMAVDGVKAGETLGALMTFYHKGVALPYYMGSPEKAKLFAMNDFMLFQQLLYAGAEKGCHTYDLGRSKVGTGSYDFKTKLGYKPEAYAYEYRLPDGAVLPDLSPKNPKYQLMIGLWKRLPLWLANRLGPLVASDLS